jgi:hypothetical protein
MDQCLCCKDAVTEHDAALQCEMCLGWQHLACNTAVSRRTYRRAVRGTVENQHSTFFYLFVVDVGNIYHVLKYTPIIFFCIFLLPH